LPCLPGSEEGDALGIHHRLGEEGQVSSHAHDHAATAVPVDAQDAKEYSSAMQSVGLAVEQDPVGPIGRGLFIGVAWTD
jgi:hypothetical protein